MQAIIATLGYVTSPDRRKVLMIRRDTRPDDLHFGYYNGLGGKLEPDEDVVAGMRRELREEAGLEALSVDLARHHLLAGLRSRRGELVRLPLPHPGLERHPAVRQRRGQPALGGGRRRAG
nr:hypothetical protein GCM10020092_010920 [Actinoplanes digitatis]